MITISLDEYGDFEYDNKTPLFIGGLVYDDKETKDQPHVEEWTERERIRAYYRKVIADAAAEAASAPEAAPETPFSDSTSAPATTPTPAPAPSGFIYPAALHSNGDKDRDHDVIRPVKNKVAETLPEFITHGTYGGQTLVNEHGKKIPPRKGEYHLFVMLKSDEGKKRLLASHASMLANDDWGANRYFHMASSVVNRLIFHNPLYTAGHAGAINIDIATRSTGSVDQLPADLVAEFKQQAYRENNAGGNHRYYSLMNAEIYRTLIAQEMVNSGNTSVQIDNLYVKSIQYVPGKPMMEFLYLSDSLCSMLGFELEGDSADDWLGQIIERSDNINPDNENLIFGYDEIDNAFSKAWACFENKEYFEALSIAFDTRQIPGAFAEHYRKVWFPYLEKRIRERINPVLFTANVSDLSELIFTNNLDQEKLLYLMRQIEMMVDSVADKYRSKDMLSSTLYKLYDTGMSAFGYIGETDKALEYYEKCRQYAYYVSLDDFLLTNNKLIVCLMDNFEWDKALELGLKNVENQQQVSSLKRELLGTGESSNFLSEAKALSQLAQVYAQKRDPKAADVFRQAMSKMIPGSSNYKITQSYLLHYLADTDQKDAFDEEMLDYFDGQRTYNQRLTYILNFDEKSDSNFSTEYVLYVLVRGLYCFHRDVIDDNLWKKLCDMDDKLTKKSGRRPSGHPWEITYTYLAILAYERNDVDAGLEFEKLRRECLSDKGNILRAIDEFGQIMIADHRGDIAARDEKTKLLAEFLKEAYSSFAEKEFSQDGDERYRELQQYFTFMYS
ncbi:hypothetical protein [Butyrivibrio sp. FCS014]|uniref:hypothetical protein n=1 Tax=Butyrivibrio sp. FCS014 TaxID=1408304 RepID=UPI000462F119|nr:hypothetical protein [Butyrivibrio sp. FCS014]